MDPLINALKMSAIGGAIMLGLWVMKQSKFIKYQSKGLALVVAFCGGWIAFSASYFLVDDSFFRGIELWTVGILFGILAPLKYYFSRNL